MTRQQSATQRNALLERIRETTLLSQTSSAMEAIHRRDNNIAAADAARAEVSGHRKQIQKLVSEYEATSNG